MIYFKRRTTSPRWINIRAIHTVEINVKGHRREKQNLTCKFGFMQGASYLSSIHDPVEQTGTYFSSTHVPVSEL